MPLTKSKKKKILGTSVFGIASYYGTDLIINKKNKRFDNEKKVNHCPVIEIKEKINKSEKNVITIVFDQFNAWSNLPINFTAQLKGYQAFKRKGLELTNIHTPTQMCSPARASLMTGTINNGVCDNIDQIWQYEVVPNLDNIFSLGKMFKDLGYNTYQFGKNHLDVRLCPDIYVNPTFNNATNNCQKNMGFDYYDEGGDPAYNPGNAYQSDSHTMNNICKPGTNKKNEFLEKDDLKLQGVIPFLRSQSDSKNKEPFFAYINLQNPHDIQFALHNLRDMDSAMGKMSYPVPFLDDQIREFGNPWFFNLKDPVSCIKNTDFFYVNFFEDNWEDYKNNSESLLYYESFLNDFVTQSKTNQTYPFLAGCWDGLKFVFTNATQDQIVFWKNFQNTYLSLIKHVDKYLYQIYETLKEGNLFENTNIVIVSDHGEMLGSHGLKNKGFHYNESTNVLGLIVSPNLNPSLIGSKCNKILNLYDIPPTLAELTMKQNLPEYSSFIGTSIINRFGNELILNKKIKNSSFGLVRNWMKMASCIPWILSSTSNNQTNIYNQITNALDYNWIFIHHTAIIYNQQYTYSIYWGLQSLINSKKSERTISNLFDKIKEIDSSFNNIYDLLINLQPNLKGLSSDIKNKINNLLCTDKKISDLFIESKRIFMEEDTTKNRLLNMMVSFILISLYPILYSFVHENDGEIKNCLIKLKENKSGEIMMKIPFENLDFYQTFDSMNKNKDYLLMLHNDSKNPSQTKNLLDTEYLESLNDDKKTKNKSIAGMLHNQIKIEGYDLDIITTRLPMMNPIAIGLISICINIIVNSQNQDIILNDTVLNILHSFGGANNMDSDLYGRSSAKQTNKFLINPSRYLKTKTNTENKLINQMNEIESMLK